MTFPADDLGELRLFEAPHLARYLAALVLTGVATLAAAAADQEIAIPNLSLIFVLPVVIAAVNFGWGPSLLASAAGVVAFNFFLIEPRYTLHVGDPADLWALGLLLAVGTLVSGVASTSRRRALAAVEHAEQALALQAYAHALVASTDMAGIAAATVNALSRLFKTSATLVLVEDGLPTVIGSIGEELSPDDLEVLRWSLASRTPVRAGIYPGVACRFDIWPIVTATRREAAIAVAFAPDRRPAEPEKLLDAVGGSFTMALDRQLYAAQALEVRSREERERFKDDLLAAVSHDLKTPLTTILFAVQSLQRFETTHDPASRAELLSLAEAETRRLTRMVANLLDMNRLDHGAIVARTSPVAPVDLAAGSIDRARSALADRIVRNEVGLDLPLVLVDQALAETAFANVLENAAKYSPPGSQIRIRAKPKADAVIFDVEDEGPGFPGAVETLFERFARGVSGDGRPPGTGLGLTIARDFLALQGGSVEAHNRRGRGARVRLVVPTMPAVRTAEHA